MKGTGAALHPIPPSYPRSPHGPNHRALPVKRFAVALAATWIGVDHGVSCSGVHLEFVKEIMPILRVGSAVDMQQSWIALPWLIAVWLHDPAIEGQKPARS